MEPITTALLASFCYDILKTSVVITAEGLKSRARDWILNENVAAPLEKEINKLELSSDLSESAIERKLCDSVEILKLLSEIKPVNSTTIIQNHTGSGDNIGHSKNIY